MQDFSLYRTSVIEKKEETKYLPSPDISLGSKQDGCCIWIEMYIIVYRVSDVEIV